MEQERSMAAREGTIDPINADYNETTMMMHIVIKTCLKKIRAGDSVQINIATHNEDTVRFTMQRMEQLGLKADEEKVSFAQLFGMCDHVTFSLAAAGYNVYKYLPYGPVLEVLPYLSRRVSENGSMMEKLSKEKKLLRGEIVRRMKALYS